MFHTKKEMLYYWLRKGLYWLGCFCLVLVVVFVMLVLLFCL